LYLTIQGIAHACQLEHPEHALTVGLNWLGRRIVSKNLDRTKCLHKRLDYGQILASVTAGQMHVLISV
jgi:hypothetical protein